MKTNLKTPVLSAVAFFWTLGILSVGYSAYTGLSSVISGQPLTVSAWTQVKNNLDDHESRISGLSTQVASIVSWGGNPWSAVTGWLAYNGGKVGIGTSAPNRNLHVYDAAQNAEIDIQSTTADGSHWAMYHNSADWALRFWHTGASDALTMAADGKIGIGTTAPSQALEVRKTAAGGAVISKVANLSTSAGTQARFDLATQTPNAYGIWSVTENGGGVASMEIASGNGITNGTYFTNGTSVDGSGLGTWPFVWRHGTSERMRVASNGNVGIGTGSPLRKLHVVGDEQLDGDLYGGLYGGTRGIWRFSSADPNFGIFYTEASPDVISFSPNGGGTGSSVMAVTGYGVGIGTSAPSEKLEINGNIKFAANGSVISKAPRAVHSVDPITGCPPARAANTDLWTMPITLDRASTVWLSGDTIKNYSLRADLAIFVDGNALMTTISPPSSDWVWAHVQWAGTLAAGSHTVSLRSPQAGAWGCGGSWGTMDALIFEN